MTNTKPKTNVKDKPPPKNEVKKAIRLLQAAVASEGSLSSMDMVREALQLLKRGSA